MDTSQIILAIIGVVASLGATTAYFKRSSGVETIKLLQQNVDAYKDSERLKDARIAYLEGQLITKDETIKRILKNGN